LLENCRKQTDDHAGLFRALDQMFDDDSQPGSVHLFNLLKHKLDQLSLICDVTDKMGDLLFRLNDSKLVKWLQCKVDMLCNYLADNEPTCIVICGAQSSTFRESSKKVKASLDELRRTAIGFISEYVDPKHIDDLATSYGITNFGPAKVNAFDDLLSCNASKGKHAAEDISPKQPEAKKLKMELSASQKKLAKTNLKGMSKLSAFFPVSKK